LDVNITLFLSVTNFSLIYYTTEELSLSFRSFICKPISFCGCNFFMESEYVLDILWRKIPSFILKACPFQSLLLSSLQRLVGIEKIRIYTWTMKPCILSKGIRTQPIIRCVFVPIWYSSDSTYVFRYYP